MVKEKTLVVNHDQKLPRQEMLGADVVLRVNPPGLGVTIIKDRNGPGGTISRAQARKDYGVEIPRG